MGVCVLKIKIQTCRGGSGLETLKCLVLHFTRFHGGEGEKDNVEQLHAMESLLFLIKLYY